MSNKHKSHRPPQHITSPRNLYAPYTAIGKYMDAKDRGWTDDQISDQFAINSPNIYQRVCEIIYQNPKPVPEALQIAEDCPSEFLTMMARGSFYGIAKSLYMKVEDFDAISDQAIQSGIEVVCLMVCEAVVLEGPRRGDLVRTYYHQRGKIESRPDSRRMVRVRFKDFVVKLRVDHLAWASVLPFIL